MKQIQIACGGQTELREELENFKKECEENGTLSQVMFQIFSEVLDEDVTSQISDTIDDIFPGTPYIGCSTSGNIVDCQLADEIIVFATCFEKKSTKFSVFQYDFSKEPFENITSEIIKEANKNPWVKAIELYFSIPEGSTTKFCDGLNGLREDIQIFGGVTCSDDITSDDCCVFSSAGKYSDKSVIVVFYGGEELFVDSIKTTGWKPLGRSFTVTKSQGSLLQELNGIPAYEVYHKYLNISNDENFFYNTLEFPLFYEHNGTTILRVPVSGNADNSINMSSDMDIGSTVRLSYGDPKTIVDSIATESRRIRDFCPDILHIFSCAARRTFWSSNEPTYELEPFSSIAPSTGFFSHGEFIRSNRFLNQHNVTLVIAAMREGEAKIRKTENVPSANDNPTVSKVPLVSRFATFISATSIEFEELNKMLETANKNLEAVAITDGLTGLYNRSETQKKIEYCLSDIKNTKLSLIMIDIDNFKQVNDTYGHQKGDAVIIALAKILKNDQSQVSTGSFAGRWGGEEFMLAIPDVDISAAAMIANLIRMCFEATSFPEIRSQTISLGVAQATEKDNIDTLFARVDSALYQAKRTGKNKVVVA